MPRKSLNIGDIADHGLKVMHIVSEEEDYVVYVTSDGKAGFECLRDFVATRPRATQLHDEIVWKCFTALPDKIRRKVLQQEAYALANSFSASDDAAADAYYKSVNQLFEAKVKEYFLLWYILGFVTTILVGGCLIAAPWATYIHTQSHNATMAIAAGITGTVGALSSILQRISSMEFNSFHSKWFYLISGKARAVIGFIFGLVLFFLVKSDILFSVAKTNSWYILVLAFLAGINERFIPDLIEQSVPAAKNQ